MDVLMSGCSGFIGYSLSQRLADRDNRVFCINRFHAQENRLPRHRNITPITADLLDPFSLEKAVRSAGNIDVVVHLGAITPVAKSFEKPVLYAETNFVGSINLFETIRRILGRQVKGIIVAGTTEMYDSENDIGHETPYKPESPYAVSKVAMAYYMDYMHRTYGLPFVLVVPTNTYGRAYVNQRHYFIEKLITSMLVGEKEIYLGTPNAVRDWMFREDHVNAYISIIDALEQGMDLGGQKFFFGTGEGYTTMETAEIIAEMIDWKGELVWETENRPNDTKKIVVDYSRSKEILGWTPEYSLKVGLEQAISEWREVLEK